MKRIILLLLLLPSVLIAQFKIELTPIQKVVIPGEVTYNLINFMGSADGVSYTPTITQNVYTKITPGMTAHVINGITFADDSLTIQSAGDYLIYISVAFTAASSSDLWRIEVYKNGAAISNIGRFITRSYASSNPDAISHFWYLPGLAVDDDISFRMTNLSASRNPTIVDFKVYMEKKPK